MSRTLSFTVASDGLTVKAYSGDHCVMLAFNVADHLHLDLAGFAVRRRYQDGEWEWLQNRLAFDSHYTADTAAKDRKWYSSEEAPFQKFWWVDFPPESDAGRYAYQVTAMRFIEEHSAEIYAGVSVSVEVMCEPFRQGKFELAFTRGYLSSQAYADRYHNAPIRPTPKNIDYDTALYEDQYAWLGAHARRTIIDFLNRCHSNPNARLDVMVYDLDEPDIIRAIAALGKRVRIVMDNAALHSDETALEPLACDTFKESAGSDRVKLGRFGRYQHNKVFLLYEDDVAVSVLTGSTNFSVNGLYVNANHVAVFNDPAVAELYRMAFDAAFDSNLKQTSFEAQEIAQGEFEVQVAGIPHSYFSFAPHATPTFSLDRLLTELAAADSSVLFAVMALKGKGDVLHTLRTIHQQGKVFSYGITDNPGKAGDGEDDEESPAKDGVTVYKPGTSKGVLISSAALNKLVPFPFSKEREEGLAHKIHHKFVVVDFNDTKPVVFFGSSNLANLGEEQNGDNLIAMYDREVATVFAIEAIRLVDHYAFRAALKKSDNDRPLRLRFKDERWTARYFDEHHLKCRERLLFSR